MAYWVLEPWGSWRDNWHSSQIAALLYNVNRGRHPAIKATDFMYVDRESKAKHDALSFSAHLRSMVARPKDG